MKTRHIVHWNGVPSFLSKKERKMAEKTVAVVGSMNCDIILKVKRLPEIGETMVAESAVMSAGGKGANQAAQVAKLGLKTYMVGAVGQDHMGDFLIQEAEKYGVDTAYVRRSANTTGLGCVSALEDGCVYATINRGANYDITGSDLLAAEPVLRAADAVIIQNEIPGSINQSVIESARENGSLIIYNAAPAEPVESRYLAMCSVVIVNEVEAAFYLKKAITTLEEAEEAGGRISTEMGNVWIITMGSMGSVICEKGRTNIIRPYKVDAVETTGAGDSYIGGLAYALLQGMDIEDAAGFATKCSAITVCGVGAQSSMPDMDQIKARFG